MPSLRICPRVFLFLTLLGIGPSLPVRAADFTGTYENAGSQISSAPPAANGSVSFQGLLGLDFDYAVTRARDAATDRVSITHTDRIFRIECFDTEDAVVWSGQWDRSEGYAPAADRVELTLLARRLPQDRFVFVLTKARESLLQVEVRRVNSSIFGPSVKEVGTYVFGRLSEQPVTPK